jgi:hypothetical protein
MDALPQTGAGITGNDWANFNILLPGAAGTPTQPTSERSTDSYNPGDAVALNGNLPNYANYLQDGGVVQLPVSNNVDNTLFEALQEVQITTSAFSSEYGIGGAVFNQITKGGTNAFHGSAYEYWQNDILNARPHFWANGAPQKVGKLRYNEWGGSIGGPIIKNKLFFYFVRDKITNIGAASATTGTTPTLAMRGQGALQGAYDFTGLPLLYDPLSCNTPGCTRTSFAAENTGALAGVNAIPANRIDPVAAKMLALYPAPTTSGLVNNFSTTLPAPNPNLRWFGRIDYEVSNKHRLSFSISQKDNAAVNKAGPFPCPINCYSGDIDGYNAQITHTWQISSSKVNQLRIAYTKQGNWFVPFTLGYDAASSLGLQYSKANVLPQLNISGSDKCCNTIQPGTNAIYIEHLWDPSDVFTMIVGRHVLKFGAEVLMGQGNTTPWGNVTAGNFTFSGNYTSQNGAAAGTTGSGYADFLLGYVEKWTANNQQMSYNRLKSPQFFVQDDFKLRPNLTVNLGLRYQGITGYHERNNSLGGFNPTLPLQCTVDKNGTPCGSFNGTPGSLWFAPGNGRDSLQKPIWNIFLPRVGFAWNLKGDTVLRGGYGLYAYNFSQDVYGNGIGFGSLATSAGNASDVNGGSGPTPLIRLSASAAQADSVLNYVVGSPNAKNVSNYLNLKSPSNQTYVPYDVPVAKIHEWQLSVERQFAHDYMASIGYVGSHANNLQFPTDLNQITDPAALNAIAGGASRQQYRPYPAWGSLGGNSFVAISNYNALQTQLVRRFANGLNFSVNYVWSHMLDEQDSGGWGNRGGQQAWQIGNNPGANYGNSNFDIPHALKGFASYDLPFGKGKQFASGNRVLDGIAGGWRLSGTFISQSGNPFTITMNDNQNGKISGCGNSCSWFPNVVGDPSVSNPGPNGWFNTAAFAAPSASGGVFQFGNERRNSLRGPSLTTVNMGLTKEIAVSERIHMELRSDWVNVFNHPVLSLPGRVLGAANFGLINNATQGGGVAVGPRAGQLSARITF